LTDVTRRRRRRRRRRRSFLQLTKPVNQTFCLCFEPIQGLEIRCLLPLTFTFLSLLGVIPAGMRGLPFSLNFFEGGPVIPPGIGCPF
jgi:hypothetical protein